MLIYILSLVFYINIYDLYFLLFNYKPKLLSLFIYII